MTGVNSNCENITRCDSRPVIGESWGMAGGMANDGEWRTGQYLVEGVNAIKCFHPRMLTPLWQE